MHILEQIAWAYPNQSLALPLAGAWENYLNQKTNPYFEDVLVGATFYTWIWRLASRAVIGGYNCGGPGEPCIAPGNLPYFRPGANATRGQASKIVSNTFFPNCVTPFAPTKKQPD